jgi:hypothetical protein
MEGRRLVWVSDSRLYYSSEESRDLPREGHEATPYASVYKFSHDIAPAKAALGSGGCIDCHRAGSPFFRGRVLSSPFGGEGGAPVWVEAHEVLGVSGWSVRLGEIREATVKPLLYLLLGLNAIIGGVLVLTWAVTRRGIIRPRGYRRWVLFSGILIAGVVILRRPDLTEYMIVDRFALDAKHFWVALATVILGAIVALESEPRARAGRRSGIAVALALIIGLATVSGGLVLLDVRWAGAAVRLSYTVFDLSLMLIAAISVVALLRFLYVVQPRGASRLDDDPAASPVG